MVAALDPLHLPPRPWHTVGLDLLSHLPPSVDFDSVLVVLDRLTRMANFFPYTNEIIAQEKSKSLFTRCVPFT
jgi:hypothetical protein